MKKKLFGLIISLLLVMTMLTTACGAPRGDSSKPTFSSTQSSSMQEGTSSSKPSQGETSSSTSSSIEILDPTINSSTPGVVHPSVNNSANMSASAVNPEISTTTSSNPSSSSPSQTSTSTWLPDIQDYDSNPIPNYDSNFDDSKKYNYSGVTYTAKQGGFSTSGSTYTTNAANTIAVNTSSATPFPYGTISVNLTYKGGDSGIIFGYKNTGSNKWEGSGVSFYFLFINGTYFHLGKSVNGTWSTIGAKYMGVNDTNHTYNLKVVMVSNKIIGIIDNLVAFTHVDSAHLTSTGFGFRAGVSGTQFSNLTVTNDYVFENDTYKLDNGYKYSYPGTFTTLQGGFTSSGANHTSSAANSLMVETTPFRYGSIQVDIKASNSSDNGNGTYTTKTSGKSIAVFQKTATNIGSYSITMNMVKGGGGASGIAFRMTHSGKNYAFEEAGTSYIGAVLGPQSGVLEICRVINGTWASVKQVALANLPTAFQNKFNGNSTFSVVMKVESYSDGFAIYLDGELALTHQDATLLADFTGTGWGMRNSTLTNTVTFSNVKTYSEKMNYMSVLTSPSAGTYYTGDTKPQLIHQFADLGTNLVTYSATFKFIKGNTVSGGVGLAFRMKLSGTNMYPYEHLGTSYISAVFCPENGSVQVSRVWGDNGSGKAHFGHLTVKTCTGATYPQSGAVASLPKDLPSAYNTKYTNAADASEITCTMMVKDYGTYFEVYIDGALALTCNDTNISSCTGTGLGIRSSTKMVTITNVSYTKSQASQVNLSGLEAVIPSKKETE